MAEIYARWIHKGKKTIDDVPSKWKEATKQILKDEYGMEV